MLSEKEVAKIRDWLKNQAPNTWDTVDAEAEIDRSVTSSENKTRLRELIPELQKQPFGKKDAANYYETQNRQAAELARQANKEIRSSANLQTHFQRLYTGLDMVISGKFLSLFCQSRTGLGKSYQITAYLNRQKKDYSVVQGFMSDAYLYRFLYENNDKLIIIRDIGSLLKNLRSLDIIKAATETHGERWISNLSYSKESEDLPKNFKCESRFIFEFNQLHFNGLREDIEALLSRGDYCNLVFSFEDVSQMMRQIAATDAEKETTEFLIRNYKFVGINSFNFRTQNKAFKIRSYSDEKGLDWQEQLKKFLNSEMTATRKGLYSLIGDKAVRTSELKKLLICSGFDGVSHLKTAERRIREWLILQELYIVGLPPDASEEEIEAYANRNRNFHVSLNPLESFILSDTSDTTRSSELN